MNLHPKQQEIVRSNARFKIIRAGRKGGKTKEEIETLVYKAVASVKRLSILKDKFDTGRKVLYIAPTQEQARNIVWEALKTRVGSVGIANEQRLQMRIPNEDGEFTTIFVGGWENRENYRGLTDIIHITFDETDTLKDFFISWKEIFRPMFLDTGGTANFIGTPKKENPNLLRLEKEFEKSKYNYEAFHFTSFDNPFLPRSELEALQKEYEGDPTSYKQEILAEYVENEGALFKYSALTDMFTNTITKSSEKYLIVDVADDGSDKTVFSFWEGLECYKVIKFKELQTDGVINQIREYASSERISYSQIIVDAIGVGAGVVSSPLLAGIVGFKSSYGAIKTEESPVHIPTVHYRKDAPLLTEYKNLRSQCIFKLALLVNNHQIAVRIDDTRLREEIIEELATYQDVSKGDGKRMATMKEDVKTAIGRSPDCFVAGTKVLTPSGEKNIEELKVGDEVVTPFGKSPISFLVKKQTQELFTLNDTLIGTGNHKVFTQNGLKRIDTLTMRDYTYSYNILDNLRWKFLKLLNIRTENIGFRDFMEDVNITMPIIKLMGNIKGELYTKTFGKIFIKKIFHLTTMCITLMEIVLTTLLRILRLFTKAITRDTILERNLKNQSIEKDFYPFWIKQGLRRVNGIVLQKVKNGIAKMVNSPGWAENKKLNYVNCATDNSRVSLIEHGIVQTNASKMLYTEVNDTLKSENVLDVTKNSWLGRMKKRGIVQNLVRHSLDGVVDVYSLTLERDNAYYANGYLVSNCSDTFIMRMYFEVIDKLKPYSSEEEQNVVDVMLQKMDRVKKHRTANSTQ